MHFSAIFIKRPVMATLLMAAFVLAGCMAISIFRSAELPSVDYPDHRREMPACPAPMRRQWRRPLPTPLEKQFSLISGLDSMTSSNALGQTRLTLQVPALTAIIDAAFQDVQAAFRQAPGRCRATCRRRPPIRK
jgi:HAE1 family hydrophobic/amphiphilic exporter-1